MTGWRKLVAFILSLASFVWLAYHTISVTKEAPDWVSLAMAIAIPLGLYIGGNVGKEAVRLANGKK